LEIPEESTASIFKKAVGFTTIILPIHQNMWGHVHTVPNLNIDSRKNSHLASYIGESLPIKTSMMLNFKFSLQPCDLTTVKVNQSLYRPGEALPVPEGGGSQNF
jgi:hypothetical protein